MSVVFQTVIAIIMSFFTSVFGFFTDALTPGKTINPNSDDVMILASALTSAGEITIISDYETLCQKAFCIDETAYDETFFEENSLVFVRVEMYSKNKLVVTEIKDKGDTLKVTYTVLYDDCGNLLFTTLYNYIIITVDKDIQNVEVDGSEIRVLHCIHN